MSFSCPLCHAPLTRAEKTFICPLGHQFDRAKEGYVNLLPVQHKRSRDPGDSAEMMQARRAFLDAGHYQPLRDAVGAFLRQYLTAGAAAMLGRAPKLTGWTCRKWLSVQQQNATQR